MQNSVTINRITVGPTPYKLDVPKNYPFIIPFTVRTGIGTATNDLRLVLEAPSQPTGQIPEGIHIQLPAPVSLTERQTVSLPVQFIADSDAQPSGALIFDIVSSEQGNKPIGKVRLDYTLSEASPYLVGAPSFVETWLAQGESQIESITIKNSGIQDAENLRFDLTRANGAPAPAWARLGSVVDGTLAVGESHQIDLLFSPPAETQEGIYELKLNVKGDNLPDQAWNIYVNLTQSGQGSVLFKASDIYTATVGKDGKLIQGLANATVTLQNEDVATVSHEMKTDALGEALFQDLPAGYYKFCARAENHQETSGRLVIKPGLTLTQPVFLDYNLIIVEWSVREVMIEGRVQDALVAVFETDVPAAVMVLSPHDGINLPNMAPGEVFHGELTLTNHGLIRAENVKHTLPPNDAYFRYEFLVEVPPVLEPKQQIVIPYRIVALRSLEDAADNASGGGCHGYSATTSVSGNYKCANGNQASSGDSAYWFHNDSSSCPGGGGSGDGKGWGSDGTSLPMRCVFIPKCN